MCQLLLPGSEIHVGKCNTRFAYLETVVTKSRRSRNACVISLWLVAGLFQLHQKVVLVIEKVKKGITKILGNEL